MDTNTFTADLCPDGTPFRYIKDVGAVPGGNAYLLDTGKATLLFDSGFGCGGDILVKNLEEILAGRSLDYILLSHSHYDHAGGSPWCAARWPDVKIISSQKTKSVFARPGARAVMRRLDASASRLHHISSENDLFDKLRVDIVLGDGDEFSAKGVSFKLIMFPGHTNCSAGFWFPESHLLLASETLGVYAGGDTVTPAFLVGCKAGIDSITRALSMDIRHMLVPHFGMIHGEHCRQYLRLALECCDLMKNSVKQGYENGMTKDELIELLMKLFFTEDKRTIQPEDAFILNAGYMIDVIIREFEQ